MTEQGRFSRVLSLLKREQAWRFGDEWLEALAAVLDLVRGGLKSEDALPAEDLPSAPMPAPLWHLHHLAGARIESLMRGDLFTGLPLSSFGDREIFMVEGKQSCAWLVERSQAADPPVWIHWDGNDSEECAHLSTFLLAALLRDWACHAPFRRAGFADEELIVRLLDTYPAFPNETVNYLMYETLLVPRENGLIVAQSLGDHWQVSCGGTEEEFVEYLDAVGLPEE